MKGKPRGSALQPWMGGLLVAGFVAAVAASFLAPLSWTQYGQYVLSRFGFPLVAAIMTAVGLLVISLMAAGRRQTSGFVALGMFISIVAHMLAASLFGLFVLSSPVAEIVPSESKVEISSSVPPMVESQLSQDMRAKFSATTAPDLRELATRKKAQVDPIEARAARLELELKHGAMPEPVKEKMKTIQASRARAKVMEALSKTEDTIPDVNKAKLVAMAPVKTAAEAAPEKRAPRELPPQAPQKRQGETLAAPAKLTRTMPRKEKQRKFERDTVKIAPVQHGGRKADEILRARSSAAKIDALNLKAEQIRDAAAPGSMEMKRAGEPSRAMDVAHQGAAAPDAPSAARLARELKGTPARAADTSLSDATPMTRQSRPSLDAAGQQRDTSRVRFPDEPVRMVDTQRALAELAAKAPAAEPVADAQREVVAGRNGQKTDIQDVPLDRPKAALTLQGLPAAGTATLGATTSREAAPAGTGRPALQEQLLATRGETGTQPLVDVGGSAAEIQAERTHSAMTAQVTGHDSFGEIAAVRSDTTQDGVPEVNSGRLARPSVNLMSAGNHAAGTGERTTFDVSGAQTQSAPQPGGHSHELASAVSRSMTMAMVDMGGTVAPVAAIATGGGGEGGGSRGALDELRHELKTGKNQTAGAWGEQGDAAVSQRANPGRALAGTAGAHNSLAGDAADVSVGGLSGSLAAHMDGAIVDSQGTAAGANAMVADITSGTAREMQAEGPGTPAGGGEAQPERASLGLELDKAVAGISQAGEQGARSQLSLPTSARSGNTAASLADVDALTVALSGGMKGSGIGQDSVSNVKSGSAAGNMMSVAFGTSGRELVAEHMAEGGGATVSPGTKTTDEISIAKAGGQFMPDGALAGAGGLKDFDSSGMSSSASRPHVRMAIDLNEGGGGQGGHSAAPTVGDQGKAMPRLLISDELASVPKTVPEKALYRLRTPEKRKEIIRELGGSDKTEQAVEDALAWLAKAQSDDGRWDVDGFKTLSRCGGPGDRSDEDVALTGLCLLSYLGAGFTHVKGEHKESVRKALNWLVDGQKADGNLQREGQMYGQAMATAALCESYSLTGDKRLVEPIEKAVDFILKAQNPGAGWRYEPRKDSDTSVTGWQVLALKSAMIAGIKIPPQHFRWVEEWLDCVRRGKEGGLYAYMPGHGGTPTMTSEGWFCQLMMEEKTRMRGQSETIPYLMARLPVWSPKDHSINLYSWYYTTLALHMSGVPEFTVWNKALVQALLTGQVKRGAAKGSWDPVCVLGERGGRVYTTATAALCLEVYYRYLPFYKQR